MKAERQPTIVRFVLELDNMELAEVKRELSNLKLHDSASNIKDSEDEEYCTNRSPYIIKLVTEVVEA
jgi:hypothetical protein